MLQLCQALPACKKTHKVLGVEIRLTEKLLQARNCLFYQRRRRISVCVLLLVIYNVNLYTVNPRAFLIWGILL